MATTEIVQQISHLGEFNSIEPVAPDQAAELSPLCPMAHSDGLDWWKYLRENAPVYQDEQGRYIFTRYDDCYGALRDPETYSAAHEMTTTDVPEATGRWVVYSDDPDHLEIRKIVNRGWTPAAIAEMQPVFKAEAEKVLATLEPGKPFDLVPFGATYTWHCFADMLGVPYEQHARIKTWSTATNNFTGPKEQRPPVDRFMQRGGGQLPGHAPGFMEAYRDMESYFVGLVEQHGQHDPKFCQREEHVSPFVRAIVASAKSDPQAMDIFLRRIFPPMLAGGLSTAAHIYVNSMDVMLDHPEVWQQVQADRALIDPERPSEVVEEMLRLKSVHAGLHRWTTRDVEVRGTLIPKGSMVQLFYISGDHDEEAFEDAEEFKLRGLSRHLAFGFGTHTCIGQSYGRTTLKILMDGLMDKFSSLERAEERHPWPFRGGYYTPDKLMVVGLSAESTAAACPFATAGSGVPVGHTSGQLLF